eukprot:m.814240 g.814240  ORF g.814240 m.814240 type:complete len:190 (+) comp23393_c0_seq2:20-589(+)
MIMLFQYVFVRDWIVVLRLLIQCLQKQNQEGARIHAENAIREKNQALHFLKLSARLDGVTERIQTAVTMQKVTMSMKGVVSGLDRAMQSMNLVQIEQLMTKFEKQQEDLDVKTSVMDQAMQASSVQSMPEGQIDSLLHEVADENDLELDQELSANPAPAGSIGSISTANAQQDDLTQRLQALRGSMPNA